MISEYHQESASSDHSDFYCFLYNKSRIKPLSKYFPTKSKSSSADIFAKDSKDTLSQRSKNVALNKDVINKHIYGIKMTEEEKIINWLASCDDDNDDNAKRDTKDMCNEKIKNNLKETNNVNESGGLRFVEKHFVEKHFVDDTVGENKNQEDKVFYKLNKGVRENSSSLKESITQRPIDDRDRSNNLKSELSLESAELNGSESIEIIKNYSVLEFHKQNPFPRKSGQRRISDDRDTSKKIKPELSLEPSELNDTESIKILKDCFVPESHKQKSLPRKNGQTKISDFFQRIS